MDLYPFFLECSKNHTDSVRKKFLENLAFGKGGLVIKKPTGGVLITENGNFNIPDKFTLTDMKTLETLVWNDESDYHKMELEIKESRKIWTNVKKRDKLRIIDHYIIKNKNIINKSLLKSIITIALILKMITNNDIKYKDFVIETLDGKFDEYYFDNLKLDPNSFKNPTTQNLLKNIWLKLDKVKDDDEDE